MSINIIQLYSSRYLRVNLEQTEYNELCNEI